jgi:hypothetical protein
VEVEFQTTGGPAYFPGLAAPITIDTAKLAADRRIALERLIEEAHFFDQPSAPTTAPRGADYQVHTITVRDGDRSHTIRVADPITDSSLAALVDALRQLRVVRKAPRRDGAG